MRICMPHWDRMRAAVEERGMSHLVARSGEEAHAAIVQELQGEEARFDPLMAMNNNFWAAAMQYGGIGMMSENPDAEPDKDGFRHYCPLCEAKKHLPGDDGDEDWVTGCADSMLQHARELGLLPPVQ